MNISQLDTYMQNGQYERAYQFMQQYNITSHAERRKVIRYLEQMEHLTDAKKLVLAGLAKDDLTDCDRKCYQVTHAFILMRQGDRNAAEDIINQLEPYFTQTKPEDIETQCLFGHYYNLLGILQYYNGNYKIAEKYYKTALKFREITKNTIDIIATLNNLGIIFEEYGDFKQAEENYRRVITLAKKSADSYLIAVASNNLGRLYSKNQDHAQAKYYLMEALTTFSALDRKLGAAESLFDLVIIAIKQKNEKEIKKLAEILNEFAESTLHPGIVLRNNIVKALQLRNENRYTTRVLAQNILKNVATQHYYEFYIYAYAILKLIEFLLEEYMDCTNAKIIEEIEKYVALLEENVLTNNQLQMYTEILLLKSKLYILKNDYRNAKKTYDDGFERVKLLKNSVYMMNRYGIYGALLEQLLDLKENETLFSRNTLLQISADMQFTIDQISSKYAFRQIANHNKKINFRKAFQNELHSEDAFPLVLYKISVNGVDITYQDFDRFPDTIDTDDYTFLFQLGISLSVLVGQGDAYNTGIYDLPAGKSEKYRLFLYAFRLKDNETTDDRMELGYFLLCIFVPKLIYSALPAVSAIEPVLTNFISKFYSAQEITSADFQRLKEDFIENITAWSM